MNPEGLVVQMTGWILDIPEHWSRLTPWSWGALWDTSFAFEDEAMIPHGSSRSMATSGKPTMPLP